MKKIRLNTTLLGMLHTVLSMSSNKLGRSSGISSSSWTDLKKDFGKISIRNLLAIANGQHIPVRRFFSSEEINHIGVRSDYVVEEYQQCLYQPEQLERIINGRDGMTWSRVASIVGMSYQGLSKSMRSMSASSPVQRLLDVCEILKIDPFTILIDPNKERTDEEKLPDVAIEKEPQDIEELQKEMERLHGIVSRLTEDMHELFSRIDKVESYIVRANELTDTDFPSIAAEPY